MQGDHVWYDDGKTGEFDLPVGAVVKSADVGQIVIVTVTKEEVWIPTGEADKKIRVMHPTSAAGVEDMVRAGAAPGAFCGPFR